MGNGTPNMGHIAGGPQSQRPDLVERVISSQRLMGDERIEKKVFHKVQCQRLPHMVKLRLSFVLVLKCFHL